MAIKVYGSLYSLTVEFLNHVNKFRALLNDYTILHRSPPPPPDCLFMKMQAGLKKRPASWEGGREKRPLQNHWAKASVWR